MNLLARILSHGFAFAVVALIILVLMYRGEFPVWELPESLAIKGLHGTAQEAGSGTVDRVTEQAEQAADATVAVPPEAPEVPLAPASSTATREATQSEDEAPATDIKPPTESETSPAPVIEPAAETTDVAEPDERIDTGAATGSQPVEFDDAPSATAPVESDESMAQSTDKFSAQTTADTPVGTGDVAADESTTTAEVVPAPTDADSSGDSIVQAPDDITTVPDDATAGTATAIETAPLVAVEETAPAEAVPTTEEQTVTSPVASEEPATTADSLSAAEPPAAPVKEAAPQAIENDVSESPYEVMAKAREAFWLRDFELAEQQYQKLTQLEPDNPDGYGEMGNMYFSQGKWAEAAEAYYQAGARLLNDGLVQEARQMVDVIRGLNGAQADDLEAQINAASAPSP